MGGSQVNWRDASLIVGGTLALTGAIVGLTFGMLALLGMMEIGNGPQAVQRWIDGFN